MNKLVNQLALLLVLVGALNWGLVGLANFDLVKEFFGQWEMVRKAIYLTIGAAALWVAFTQVAGEMK